MSTTAQPNTFSSQPQPQLKLDAFGFPSAPTPLQERRMRVAHFTCTGQWTRYPTPSSALRAPSSALLELAHTHGICVEYRRLLWSRSVAAVRARKGSPPLDYSAMVHLSSGVEEELGRQIELDLPRTFADQRDFARAIAAKDGMFDGSRSTAYASSAAASAEPQVVGGGDMHDTLRRLLRLFCVRNPGLGYLQSMNFVAAFMLLVFGRENEGEAYACFETLVCDILEGWYTQDMGMLRVDFQVVSRLMNQRLVSLAAHVSMNLGFPDIASLFLPRWMLCIFLNCFPADATVRVWDVLFMEALVEAEGEGGKGRVVASSSSTATKASSLPPGVAGLSGPGGAGPRFLVEVCLALMSSCAEEIESCDNFPDAVEVLKDAGSRMRDVAELLALTKLPTCSLGSAPMGVWRAQCAPELLHEALGGRVDIKAVQLPPSRQSFTTGVVSGSPSRCRFPSLLSSRGTTGLTPPPVAIGSTLESVISPLSGNLSVACLARLNSPLSPRFKPIAAVVQSSLALEGAKEGQASSFSSLQLGDLVALASTLNPSLATSTLFGATSSLTGSNLAPPSHQKRVSGGEVSLTSSATAFASSLTSAVKHFATDASRLASSLSSKIITAYAEFDADAIPLPSSPTPSGVEAVKRSRRHESREGVGAGGGERGAMNPIQQAAVSVSKGEGTKKGELAIQLSLLSPPRSVRKKI